MCLSPSSLPSLHPLLSHCSPFISPPLHQSGRWKEGMRESKSGKNRKGLISSVGQRWIAWGGSGNEILPVPFYQPFKAHYSGEGETYKAPALEHISVCLWETERGCCTHTSVIDSQFSPPPFSLFFTPFLFLSFTHTHLYPCITIPSLSISQQACCPPLWLGETLTAQLLGKRISGKRFVCVCPCRHWKLFHWGGLIELMI